MRYFIILTPILLFIMSSCKIKSTSDIKMKSEVEKISLSEQTRGTNRIFTFSEGKFDSSKNGIKESMELTLSNWSKISENVNDINIDKISKFEAPSTKRYSDAALTSTITITKNGLDYKSSDFDSGNPPLELRNLYNEIQKIIETKKSK